MPYSADLAPKMIEIQFVGLPTTPERAGGSHVYFNEPGATTSKTVFEDKEKTRAHAQGFFVPEGETVSAYVEGGYLLLVQDSQGQSVAAQIVEDKQEYPH